MKPPLLLSSGLSKNTVVNCVESLNKDSDKSDKSLYESLMKSKDSLTLSKLAYPEYLEALISPHKSCSTCAKINNFVNTVNSKSKEETDTEHTQQDEAKQPYRYSISTNLAYTPPRSKVWKDQMSSSERRHENKKATSKTRKEKKQASPVFEYRKKSKPRMKSIVPLIIPLLFHQEYHDVKEKMQDELKVFMKEAITKIQQYKNDILKEISDAQ